MLYQQQKMKRRCSVPEEIVGQILSFLPKKSRGRFRCVSKQWCNLISHPNLVFVPKTTKAGLLFHCFDIKAYGGSTCSATFLRLDNKGGASVDSSIPFNINTSKEFKIRDSCNGFLLLSRLGFKANAHLPMFLVYNPITNFSQHVSYPPQDQTLGFHCLGLVSDRNHLNVIFLADHNRPCFVFAVFSLEDKTWTQKVLRRPCDPPLNVLENNVLPLNSLFFKGALHFPAPLEHLYICHIQEEFCKFIPLPRIDAHRRFLGSGFIWEFEGRLHYCEVTRNREEIEWALSNHDGGSKRVHIDIWVLHIEGHKYIPSSQQRLWWQHKHSGVLLLPSVIYRCEPFAFNEDFEILYLKFNDSIISYNPETRKQEVAYKCSRKGRRADYFGHQCLPFLYIGD